MNKSRFRGRAWNPRRREMLYFDFDGQDNSKNSVYAYEGETQGIILSDLSTPLFYNDEGLNPKLEIMMSTGLKDKNGKEIYEDDVIKNDGMSYAEVASIPEVYYSCDEWVYEAVVQVLGNKWENPDLWEEVQA